MNKRTNTANNSPDINGVQFFTLKEVAEKARVSERTLHRYIQSGKLEAVKFGGKWKISDIELKKVLNVA